MATVIGFVSEKGGVGKTTAVYHVAASLSRDHGARVLVLDTDYQRGGVTCRLIPSMIEDFRNGKVSDPTLYAVYRSLYTDTEPLPTLCVLETSVNIDLVPADPRLNDISTDKMPAPRNLRDGNRRLLRHLLLIREAIEPLAGDYDYVLIDSHPDLHDLEKAVIAASDYLVSPVKLDQQSSVAVASTSQSVNDVNADIDSAATLVGIELEYSPTIFLGAIGMMCREYGQSLKYSEQLIYNRLTRSSDIFQRYVTEGDGLRQAAQTSASVYDLKFPNAVRQAEQFRGVTEELLERMNAHG
ncbi:MAG: ParA family protein [Gammaproteobacteria bacterium]|nr:ParA family protein [Gammaproteobacteria bacterium]